MLQVGIFNGYFPYPLEEQAKKIKSIGFNTVQLDLAFKDIDFSTPDSITVAKAKRVRETFRDVRIFAEVEHPGLALLMDPTNYFEAHNIDRMQSVPAFRGKARHLTYHRLKLRKKAPERRFSG
jgi:sugar phosphate isomerase/epimerase